MNDNPIFAVAERAAQLRADGFDVVTLAVGEPQTAMAEAVARAAAAAALDPDAHHYGPAQGDPELRAEIAARLRSETTVPWSAREVQVTLGAKHALHLAIRAIAEAGDEVLVAASGWAGHAAAARAASVCSVEVPTDAGFRLTVGELKAARTPRTRAVILSSPGDPTGAVYDGALLRAIVEWAATHGIGVISDDIYASFDYTGIHRPVLSVVPELREHVVLVGSVSKEHAMTGWSVGWIAASEPVIASARRHVAQTITHVPNVPQRAALETLRDSETPKRAAAAYRERRDRLFAALDRIDGIDAPAPGGGMFVFADVRAFIAAHGIPSSAELAARLLKTAHVAVVPGEAFGAPGFLRLCFAVDDTPLDAAITRLTSALTNASTLRQEGACS